jgi:citrate lyase subunit alpha / citrate CoA-transferase
MNQSWSGQDESWIWQRAADWLKGEKKMPDMMTNAVGRMIPTYVEGIGKLTPFSGAFNHSRQKPNASVPVANHRPGDTKMVPSIRSALEKCDLSDGMTLSFHHHFRTGDHLVNMVMDEVASMGIRNITIAPSSLQNIHDHLIPYIREGIITGIQTSGLRGEIARQISAEGILKTPVVIRSHGGRARAIEAGDTKIDIAVLGAPASDSFGNVNGVEGPNACGSLGYAMADAAYAQKTVVVTDHLIPYPACPISIPQTQVDYVVVAEGIGDPKGIVSGATRITQNPMELLIAEKACQTILASGLVQEGFSFQAGTGGSSLAVAHFLRQYMREQSVRGSFASGGITGYLVDMLEEGLFQSLMDVQCFDQKAIESIRINPHHVEMSASYYANPHTKGCVAHQLDIMILSATEIDVNFNVNVITGSNGIMMGASGGHCDTAAGSKLAVVVAPLFRGRLPIVLDEVTTVVTPGESIDVLVTEYGVAVNPERNDLKDRFNDNGLEVMDIHDLKEMAEKITGKPKKPEVAEEIVGLVEYRDGTIIDTIKKVI